MRVGGNAPLCGSAHYAVPMTISRVMVMLLTCTLLGVLAAPAAAETDVTGSWFHNERFFSTGGADLGGLSGVYDDITLQDGAGGFSGQRSGDGTNAGPIRGTIAAGNVFFVLTRDIDGTTLRYRGTVSDGGKVISGYSAFCTPTPGHALQQGTFVISLPGATTPLPTPASSPAGSPAIALCDDPVPTGPDFRHPTSTVVQCYAAAAAGDPVTCEATVTDTGTPPETPSSAVTFTVAAGQGSLPGGTSCTLAASSATPGSPGTCQIAFRPATGTIPAVVPIQASYVGDSDHKPSAADHGTLVSGPPPPPSTLPPIQTPTFTLPQCQDYTLVPSNLTIPLGDYTGPDGEYGAKAQNILSCSLVASAAIAAGGKWVTQTLAGSLMALDSGSRFVRTFRTFIPTSNGWQEAQAQIHPWATSQTTAYATGLHDPPAPSYTKLAAAKPAQLPLIRVAGSAKDRATARTINTWLKGMATSRGLSDAFTVTVNRAGGARKAGNTAWQGRQTRLAVTLANALAKQDTALVAVTRKVATLAATSPRAKRGLPAKTLSRLRTHLARSGLSGAQRARLRRLGYDAQHLAAVVAAAKDTSVPTSALLATPAKVFADPALVSQLSSFALFFKLWAVRPEVAAGAALH